MKGDKVTVVLELAFSQETHAVVSYPIVDTVKRNV